MKAQNAAEAAAKFVGSALDVVDGEVRQPAVTGVWLVAGWADMAAARLRVCDDSDLATRAALRGAIRDTVMISRARVVVRTGGVPYAR